MTTRRTVRAPIRVRLERTATPESWKKAAPGLRALLDRHPWLMRAPARETGSRPAPEP